MSTLSRSEVKLQFDELQHYDQEDNIGGYCSLSSDHADSPGGGSSLLRHGNDQEKRIRREIANSNERRRMQSINAGFQSLRTLLPSHEGEKLSKAAILQQTAEYIYQLEQEKTSLLSQNCQLKRLINQQEGETTSPPVKKRKTEPGAVLVNNIAISESSDEGIGPMSPEPLTITGANPPAVVTTAAKEQDPNSQEMIELRVQLDRERGLRMILEEQIRSLETQLYPERIREITQQVQMQYQTEEVEVEQEELGPPIPVEILSVRSLGLRRNSQTTNTSSVDDSCFSDTEPETLAPDMQPVAHVETVIATPSTSLNKEHHQTPTPATSAQPTVVAASVVSPPPPPPPSRLPSILEAAIKAEPKVEVERLPSPTGSSAISAASCKTSSLTGTEKGMPQARVYLASTSRQNLETIVEAIRHLEGDHLFNEGTAEPDMVDEQDVTQDVPLALTKHAVTATSNSGVSPRILKVDVNPFIQFHSRQQQRPGVIVVKQHT